jgi:predicted DNA-binding ribbon-helix-helix protein
MIKLEVIQGLSSQAVNKKRSVVVDGHRTSVSLEPIFWDQLREISSQRRMSVNELVTLIGQQRNGSLSSAIRVFVLENVLKLHRFARAVSGPRPHYRQ